MVAIYKIKAWLADLLTSGEYSRLVKADRQRRLSDLSDILECIAPSETPYLKGKSYNKEEHEWVIGKR